MLDLAFQPMLQLPRGVGAPRKKEKPMHTLSRPYLSVSRMITAMWLAISGTALSQTPQAQYEADLKLCADEPVAEARLQCRRDARLVFDKAQASASKNPAPVPAPAVSATKPTVACPECARVTSVSMIDKPGDSNATGMIAGGLAGAMLGRQIGGGLGKDLSTIAGAAGGAYAGKKIQENMNASKIWRVSVSFSDGRSGTFDFAQDPGFSSGDSVRQSGDTLVKN